MSCHSLEIRGLTVELADGSRALVNNIHLTVESGESVAVVGESGAGKSMTSLAVMNLLPQGVRKKSGTILLDNRDLGTLAPEQMQAVRAGEIGMIMQNPMSAFDPVFTLFSHFKDTLVAGGFGRIPEDPRGTAVAALAEVGLPDPEAALDAYPFQLSGGMLQRAMIALALVNRPHYLIADEPTTDLDLISQKKVLDLIRERCRAMNLGLLLITHDLSVAAYLVNSIAVMHRGRIVEQASARTILENPYHGYSQVLAEAHRRLHGKRFAAMVAAGRRAGGTGT